MEPRLETTPPPLSVQPVRPDSKPGLTRTLFLGPPTGGGLVGGGVVVELLVVWGAPGIWPDLNGSSVSGLTGATSPGVVGMVVRGLPSWRRGYVPSADELGDLGGLIRLLLEQRVLEVLLRRRERAGVGLHVHERVGLIRGGRPLLSVDGELSDRERDRGSGALLVGAIARGAEGGGDAAGRAARRGWAELDGEDAAAHRGHRVRRADLDGLARAHPLLRDGQDHLAVGERDDRAPRLFADRDLGGSRTVRMALPPSSTRTREFSCVLMRSRPNTSSLNLSASGLGSAARATVTRPSIVVTTPTVSEVCAATGGGRNDAAIAAIHVQRLIVCASVSCSRASA